MLRGNGEMSQGGWGVDGWEWERAFAERLP